MSNPPLKGIRILDLTHYWAGPTATRIMADLGAEVIKVENVRRLCVLRGAKKEDKAYNRHPRWYQVNRNKLSITLDLKSEQDRSTFKALAKISDVVVENFRGGVLGNLGFGFEKLRQLRSDVIMVSMPAFGGYAPYHTYAGVGASIEALSGVQSLTAYTDNGKRFRIKEMDVICGVMGACAIITALIHRHRTGQGQYVDLSQMEAGTHALIGDHLLQYATIGTQERPLGNRHHWFAPQGCYRCSGTDKWVAITVRTDEEWWSLCEVSRHPEWKTDTRFLTREDRMENHDDLDRLIEGWTKDLDHYHVMHALQQAGVPAAAVLDIEELVHDPHLKERDYFMTSEDGTNTLFPGVPYRLSDGEIRIGWRGPDLGQHNLYVLSELLGRHPDDVLPVNEEDIGTGFDPE